MDTFTSERREKMSQQSGFTILETCVAMVIMLIAVLGSMSLFVYSIQNNSNANDRELSMAVAQKKLEELRNLDFTDSGLNTTSPGGVASTIERAGRSYDVTTTISSSNVIDGAATLKTITIQVVPTGSTLGGVIVRSFRTTNTAGPYR